MVGIRVICAGIGLALLASAPAAGYTGYVTNRGDDDVSVLDTTSGAVGAKIGPDVAVEDEPGPIAATPDGKSAWVVNLSGQNLTGDISVINTQTRTLSGGLIHPDGTEGLAGIAMTPNGSEAYVPNIGGGNVFAINTATRTDDLIGVGTGGSPMTVATNPVLAEAYVTDSGPDPGTDPAELSTVDTATKTSDPGDDVSVGDPSNLPTAVGVNPAGTKAYVVNGDDDDVSVVDLTTDPPTLVGTDIAVGAAPSAIAVRPGGSKAYVTNSGDDSVTPIDLSNDTAGTPIALATGSAPSAVAFTPDGARAYVTNQGNDDVSVINASTDAVVGSPIPVGGEPAGIALFTVPAVSQPPSSPPPPQQVPPVVIVPPPQVGNSFNLEPVEGTTVTKCKGESEFTALVSPTQVQVGCVVDATNGVVRLTAATGVGDGTQSAEFWAGQFKVLQNGAVTSAKGSKVVPTTLKLTGPLRAGGKRAARATDGSDAHVSKKRKKRKLWGRGKGKFKTRGKRGTASIRGTTWLTEDRSDKSTRLKVKQGKVRFKDFVKNRTVTVRSGDSYVAKKR